MQQNRDNFRLVLFRRLADFDSGIRRDAGTQHIDHLAVDLHPTVDDPLISFTARTQAQLRHAFGQAREIGIGGQRLGRKHRIARTILIKITLLEAIPSLAPASRRIAPLHRGFRRIAFELIALELTALQRALCRGATIRRHRLTRLAVMTMVTLAFRLVDYRRFYLPGNVGLRFFRFFRRACAYPFGSIRTTHRLVRRIAGFGFGGWEFECGQCKLSFDVF